MPPPSKGEEPDNPIELPVAAPAPVVGLPAAGEVPIPDAATDEELAVKADAGAVETPAHIAPIKGEAPAVVGLTPGLASSVAPMGIPVCPTGAFGMPNGDVMPSAGSGDTFMRVCAYADPQPKRTTPAPIPNPVRMRFALILPPRSRR